MQIKNTRLNYVQKNNTIYKHLTKENSGVYRFVTYFL